MHTSTRSEKVLCSNIVISVSSENWFNELRQINTALGHLWRVKHWEPCIMYMLQLLTKTNVIYDLLQALLWIPAFLECGLFYRCFLIFLLPNCEPYSLLSFPPFPKEWLGCRGNMCSNTILHGSVSYKTATGVFVQKCQLHCFSNDSKEI